MEISVGVIKELRELTSCGVIECKKALEEAKGDITKAKEVLQKRGLEIAARKSGRAVKEGRIESYVHMGNKIGVLLEVSCETDFVARSETFCAFTKDVAMHIAAVNPQYIRREDVPQDIMRGQHDPEGFAQQACLLEQPFVKDPKKTVQDYMNELISSTGENICIGRFIRYKVNDVS
ncbi:MAG TPA: elongation factor Ts [Candidatus Omnitrophica bacterium]|nr:MAG: hypothetical protein A2Y05_01860 [Omnitrophica WOR_2 bacterium GWA2_53_43]HBO97469.1 elongation factor Ts [Candidatus Omnitrophota bacterium]HCI44241.1 elongation factor Ts [Candidatus Omnitrophota bacterium]